MISYEWQLVDGGKILLEKDPQPLPGYESTYQLRYEDIDTPNGILDYNFSMDERFEYRVASLSLISISYNLEFSNSELLKTIVDEANTLVSLGRNT